MPMNACAFLIDLTIDVAWPVFLEIHPKEEVVCRVQVLVNLVSPTIHAERHLQLQVFPVVAECER